MKGFLILLVTAIVVCVGNRTRGVHKHRHGKTGHKPERDTGSITLKPGTAKNKLFSGYGTNCALPSGEAPPGSPGNI